MYWLLPPLQPKAQNRTFSRSPVGHTHAHKQKHIIYKFMLKLIIVSYLILSEINPWHARVLLYLSPLSVSARRTNYVCVCMSFFIGSCFIIIKFIHFLHALIAFILSYSDSNSCVFKCIYIFELSPLYKYLRIAVMY